VTLPQLLIVDLYMPLDSGLALIATLRADDASHPCGSASAPARMPSSIASVRWPSGADFYLEKPIDLGAVR
jgi:CheY-like chemotaxis protein